MSELEPGPSTSSAPGGNEGQKPRMPRHRMWSLAMLGLAVVVAGMATVYLFTSGGSASPKFGSSGLTNLSGAPTPIPNTGVLDPTRPEVGKPVPNFALADARNPGHVLKLSDFAGKPIVLNFYASWCIPCREEIPAFQAAQATLGDRVQFIGVDYLETAAKATGILDQYHATYPSMLDTNGVVADHYRVSDGLPQTFFIDKDGVLVTRLKGGAVGTVLADALAKIGLKYTPPAK